MTGSCAVSKGPSRLTRMIGPKADPGGLGLKMLPGGRIVDDRPQVLAVKAGRLVWIAKPRPEAPRPVRPGRGKVRKDW